MPLHNWLPSAMVAPTPVSALLHAVAVVKAGVFSICRVHAVRLRRRPHGPPRAGDAHGRTSPPSPSSLASVIALTKDDLKARLAYSTVSQLSYVVLGVAMLAPLAVTGGLAHIAHHAFSKITLFFTRRGDLRRHPPEEDQHDVRHGPRACPGPSAPSPSHRCRMIGVPPVVRVREQVVHGQRCGRPRGTTPLLAGAAGEHDPERGLLHARHLQGLLRGSPPPGSTSTITARRRSRWWCRCASRPRSSVFLGLYPETFIQLIRCPGRVLRARHGSARRHSAPAPLSTARPEAAQPACSPLWRCSVVLEPLHPPARRRTSVWTPGPGSGPPSAWWAPWCWAVPPRAGSTVLEAKISMTKGRGHGVTARRRITR
ncbi:MAG: hypothetical protein MZU95_02335 [Desulfomicrobium escambiense]|nr:hypothetical protein [Desulfomicrobium escambiense]